MSRPDPHVDRIRAQFTRQSESYAEMQQMVPVIVGANDADLAASPARTREGLFAAFGPLAPQARKLYDPKGCLASVLSN